MKGRRNVSINLKEIKSQHELNDGKRSSDVLVSALEKCNQLELKIIALESELKEVCDVLIKVSPNHVQWVMSNWKYLYDEMKEMEKSNGI